MELPLFLKLTRATVGPNLRAAGRTVFVAVADIASFYELEGSGGGTRLTLKSGGFLDVTCMPGYLCKTLPAWAVV